MPISPVVISASLHNWRHPTGLFCSASQTSPWKPCYTWSAPPRGPRQHIYQLMHHENTQVHFTSLGLLISNKNSIRCLDAPWKEGSGVNTLRSKVYLLVHSVAVCFWNVSSWIAENKGRVTAQETWINGCWLWDVQDALLLLSSLSADLTELLTTWTIGSVYGAQQRSAGLGFVLPGCHVRFHSSCVFCSSRVQKKPLGKWF